MNDEGVPIIIRQIMQLGVELDEVIKAHPEFKYVGFDEYGRIMLSKEKIKIKK